MNETEEDRSSIRATISFVIMMHLQDGMVWVRSLVGW